MLHSIGRGTGGLSLSNVNEKGRSERRARVSRRRLNPDRAEGSVVTQASIHDAVERHAARQTKVCLGGPAMEPTGQFEHRFFQHLLEGSGNIIVSVVKRLSPATGRAEPLAEIPKMDFIPPLVQQVHDLSKFSDVPGLAVGGERHHLVFI